MPYVSKKTEEHVWWAREGKWMSLQMQRLFSMVGFYTWRLPFKASLLYWTCRHVKTCKDKCTSTRCLGLQDDDVCLSLKMGGRVKPTSNVVARTVIWQSKARASVFLLFSDSFFLSSLFMFSTFAYEVTYMKEGENSIRDTKEALIQTSLSKAHTEKQDRRRKALFELLLLSLFFLDY